MCVGTQNVLGSDPCEAEQLVLGWAEDLRARSRVAACRPSAPGHPPTPKPCLGTAGDTLAITGPNCATIVPLQQLTGRDGPSFQDSFQALLNLVV